MGESMDKVVREQAMNFFFRPTTVLLQQYGRYADSNEVATFQRRFDDLKAELTLAFDSGEAYEAHLTREELKKLCGDLQRKIDLYKRHVAIGSA